MERKKTLTKRKAILWLCLFLISIIIVCLVLIKIEINKKTDELILGDSPEASEVDKEASASVTATSAIRDVAKEEGAQKQSQMAFEIYFPASWGNIEVVESEFENGVKTVQYNIKTTDNSYQGGSSTIITIRQYEKSVENKIGTQIATNDNFEFFYTTWESAPSDILQITEKELSSVLETFKLLD